MDPKNPPPLTAWQVFDQAVSEIKASNAAVPAKEIEAEIDEALAAVRARAPGASLDRVALKEATTRMKALLQQEGLAEADLDEVTRDFRAWRKTARK